jgi:hypothetical protein
LADEGIDFSHSDLDSESTGRAEETGLMLREKVAEVNTINITLVSVKPDVLARLITECRKLFVTIRFSDPFNGWNVTTALFYNANRNGIRVNRVFEDGQPFYDRVSLQFVGRGIPIAERFSG